MLKRKRNSTAFLYKWTRNVFFLYKNRKEKGDKEMIKYKYQVKEFLKHMEG